MRLAILIRDSTELELVCSVLNSAGHTTLPYQSGGELLHNLKRDSVDMLVLDWLATDLAPEELLLAVRDKLQPELPVLFMTARADEDDIVAGLDCGGNDYLIKPIRKNELGARVQALLRRTYPQLNIPENCEFRQYLFETRSARLTFAGQFIELTQKEFDLALLLFRNLGRPLSRAYILDAIWSRDVDIPSRTLDTHISRVRNKCHLKPENGFRLTPVYSYGYRLEELPAVM